MAQLKLDSSLTKNQNKQWRKDEVLLNFIQIILIHLVSICLINVESQNNNFPALWVLLNGLIHDSHLEFPLPTVLI